MNLRESPRPGGHSHVTESVSSGSNGCDKGGWLNSHKQHDILRIVFHTSAESQMQGPPILSRCALSALLACCGQLPHRVPIWPSLNL
jgi:hypothetical protein